MLMFLSISKQLNCGKGRTLRCFKVNMPKQDPRHWLGRHIGSHNNDNHGKREKNNRRQKYINALVDTRAEFIRTRVYGVIVAIVICFICSQNDSDLPSVGG